MDSIKFKLSSSQNIKLDLSDSQNLNFSLGNGVLIPTDSGFKSQIVQITKEQYKAQSGRVSSKDILYVITDYYQDEEGKDSPALCVGDGNAYLGDLPIVSALTAEERELLKQIADKVGVIADEDNELLIFYK